MFGIGNLELDELNDAGLLPQVPWDDLACMLEAFRFHNGISRVVVILAAPLKEVQEACCMKVINGLVTLFRQVWGNDQVSIHISSKL